MRASRVAGFVVLSLLLAAPASAEGFNNLLAGLNGLITFPADPVMSTIDPPEEFGELPGAEDQKSDHENHDHFWHANAKHP